MGVDVDFNAQMMRSVRTPRRYLGSVSREVAKAHTLEAARGREVNFYSHSRGLTRILNDAGGNPWWRRMCHEGRRAKLQTNVQRSTSTTFLVPATLDRLT